MTETTGNGHTISGFKIFINGKEQAAASHIDLMIKPPPASWQQLGREAVPMPPEVVYQGEIGGTFELELTETDLIERVLFYKSRQLGRYMPLDLAIYAALWRGKGPSQFWALHQRLQGGCRAPRGKHQHKGIDHE